MTTSTIREALEDAAKTFREYARLHAAKPDMVKANRNTEHAQICEKALAHLDAIQNAPADGEILTPMVVNRILDGPRYTKGTGPTLGQIIKSHNALHAAYESAKAQPSTEWLTFGEYTISQGRSDQSKLWIGHESGEGGEFDRDAFSEVIREFYAEHF